MAGIPWDQPGADPLGDLHRARRDMERRRYDPAVFMCPAALWQAWKEQYGREMTPADIPFGHWDRIEVVEPCPR